MLEKFLHFLFRKKYEGTKITFKNIVDLQLQFYKPIPFKTIQEKILHKAKNYSTLFKLIKSYLESHKNKQGKKQVKKMFE